jgi:hypothetical protein
MGFRPLNVYHQFNFISISLILEMLLVPVVTKTKFVPVKVIPVLVNAILGE